MSKLDSDYDFDSIFYDTDDWDYEMELKQTMELRLRLEPRVSLWRRIKRQSNKIFEKIINRFKSLLGKSGSV